MMQIIGLAGRAGSGKTSVARELVGEYGAAPLSFASPFKVAAVVRGDVDAREAFGPRPKSAYTRRMLQRLGTEMGRDIWGTDWWIRHMDVELYRLGQYGEDFVVVDDVRYQNEVDYIRGYPGGMVYRLTREGEEMRNASASHPSESGLDNLHGVYAINNSGERQTPYDTASTIVCLHEK